MTNVKVSCNRPAHVISTTARAAVLACLLTGSLWQAATAANVIPPSVPDDIAVPDGNKAFLTGHARGVQTYACSPSKGAAAWVLFAPAAALFSNSQKQLTTHFFSPNPFEDATDPTVTAPNEVRATWLHSSDSSMVWAKPIASSSDPDFVRPNSIAWVLLEAVGSREGPTGGDKLMATTYILRANTADGVPPPADCSKAKDVGKKAFIPYTADYYFFRSSYVQFEDAESND